ncbi:metallophosphoesterase [Sphingomonas sp. SRS2]|uniref:metallophosphoesterase n=1 Tax=Sphingomonas sp. SRS2 TaxID=133190 RepID=UPI0006184250|nr:metallophosphoesterase [Sphingomonas sp. SRS2]KKC27766.1 metallophosphoesterase [Sphingomonas sp. SRS2]
MSGALAFAEPRSASPAPHVDGQLAYAIGDVHGCYGLFRDLLAKIARDAAMTANGRRPIIIQLGDLIDRGPHSAQVVEAATWLQRRGDIEFQQLMGNHERAMLDFLEQPDGEGWLMFGGGATMRSYGVEPPALDAPATTFIAARDAMLQRMPASHLRSIEHARSMVTLGDYAFVHAGIKPGVALAEQEEDALLWIGEEFTESRAPFEKIVVHGHTIENEARIRPNRIGIDTGAYMSGILTALRIEDGDMRLIQAGKESGHDMPL